MAVDVKPISAALLITDSFKASVNGIAMFSQFFVTDVLQKQFDVVAVLEMSNQSVHLVQSNGEALSNIAFDAVYVNAHFSASDHFIRNHFFASSLLNLGIVLKESYSKTLISHGWTKIEFRFNLYGIFYRLKFLLKQANLNRLFFYNTILFISREKDNNRHADYLFSLDNNIPVSYYDFPQRYIESLAVTAQSASSGNDILVIANFEPVKNLWWLVRYNLVRKFIKRKSAKPFVLLIKPKANFMFRLFARMSALANVSLVTNQQQKNILLQSCNYLFIPSHTEYTPLVGFEAFASHKPVVSLYRITGLTSFSNYHYLHI